MTVHIVLDSSALRAYAVLGTQSMAVAELLTSVHENEALVGVPAMCVLDSFAQLAKDEQQRVEELLLATDGVAVVLPLLAEETLHVAKQPGIAAMGKAHALAEARLHEAMLATFDRAAYGTELNEDDILDLSQ